MEPLGSHPMFFASEGHVFELPSGVAARPRQSASL